MTLHRGANRGVMTLNFPPSDRAQVPHELPWVPSCPTRLDRTSLVSPKDLLPHSFRSTLYLLLNRSGSLPSLPDPSLVMLFLSLCFSHSDPTTVPSGFRLEGLPRSRPTGTERTDDPAGRKGLNTCRSTGVPTRGGFRDPLRRQWSGTRTPSDVKDHYRRSEVGDRDTSGVRRRENLIDTTVTPG